MIQRKQTYTPFLIEKLLNNKQVTLQSFFNLEELPKDIKSLDSSEKIIKNIRYKIKDLSNESNEVIKNCNNDYLEDAKKSASCLVDSITDFGYYTDELEKIIQQYEIAYESLESLIKEILNKEKIDLGNYSSNITETELKSYNRIKVINKLLKDK